MLLNALLHLQADNKHNKPFSSIYLVSSSTLIQQCTDKHSLSTGGIQRRFSNVLEQFPFSYLLGWAPRGEKTNVFVKFSNEFLFQLINNIIFQVKFSFKFWATSFQGHRAYWHCYLTQSPTKFGTVCYHSIYLQTTWGPTN